MGQVPHRSARTTEAARRAIELRRAGVRALARRYGVGPATVRKRRQRTITADARMGPKEARSTVPALEAAAVIVAFRRDALLPL